MDGVLFETVTAVSRASGSLAWVQQLRREMAELRAEVIGLRRENLELRQQVGYWKSQHARAMQRVRELEQEVERLKGENRKLQDQLFGRKSEKQSAADRSNELEGERAAAPKRKRGQQRGKPGPGRRRNERLPVVDDPQELPKEQQVCPQCGQAMSACGSEDSETLEIDVKAHRRKIRRQRYQRTCTCTGSPRTLTAPAPPKLIPKGRLGISIWVEILLDKFHSYRPTERLLDYWQTLNLDVAPATVAEGLCRLEPMFTPLYELLLTRNAQGSYAQADETRWQVFIDWEGKTGYCWWLWVFLGQDTVAYRLDPQRSHDVPEAHFGADARLILMVDRYSAYKAMAQVKAGHIVLVFCWAHVRRDFVRVGKGWPELKEWALAWLWRIRDLYRLNRERLANLDKPQAFAAADAAMRQGVAALHDKATAELADPHLRDPCRKTLDSLLEHWSGLTLFVEDPRIPMDNNASERQVRGPALGRKNYYGSGALWSGRLAAMLFSLFATLRLWKLNPREWLTWYLQSCAAAGGCAPPDVTSFLPWNMSDEQRANLSTDPPHPKAPPNELIPLPSR